MAPGTPVSQFKDWGWNEVEELLQCPICFEQPGGVIEQCIHGHHICSKCKKKVEHCPLCKSPYLGTRNFVAEELVRNYEVLKNTMLLNNLVCDTTISKKTDKNKKNKTKKKVPKVQPVLLEKILHLPTPSLSKGMYPCKISNCDKELPLARLLNHVRCAHSNILTEASVDNYDKYLQTFEFMFLKKKFINKINYAMFVSGVGLLYLTLEIFPTGELIGALQIASKFGPAKIFRYEMEIFGENDENQTFIQRPSSCRRTMQCILQERMCLFISAGKLKRMAGISKKLFCKISISRGGIGRRIEMDAFLKAEYKILYEKREIAVQKEVEEKIIEELSATKKGKKKKSAGNGSNSSGNNKGNRRR